MVVLIQIQTSQLLDIFIMDTITTDITTTHRARTSVTIRARTTETSAVGTRRYQATIWWSSLQIPRPRCA